MRPWTIEVDLKELEKNGEPEGFHVVVNMGATLTMLYARKPLYWILKAWYRLGGRYMLWWAAYKLGALKVEPNMILSSGKWRWPFCTKLRLDHELACSEQELAYHIHRAQKGAWEVGYKQGHEDGVGYMRARLFLEKEGDVCSPN